MTLPWARKTRHSNLAVLAETTAEHKRLASTSAFGLAPPTSTSPIAHVDSSAPENRLATQNQSFPWRAEVWQNLREGRHFFSDHVPLVAIVCVPSTPPVLLVRSPPIEQREMLSYARPRSQNVSVLQPWSINQPCPPSNYFLHPAIRSKSRKLEEPFAMHPAIRPKKRAAVQAIKDAPRDSLFVSRSTCGENIPLTDIVCKAEKDNATKAEM